MFSVRIGPSILCAIVALALPAGALGRSGLRPGDEFVAAAALRAGSIESPAPQPSLVDKSGRAAKYDDIENHILRVRTVGRGQPDSTTFTIFRSGQTFATRMPLSTPAQALSAGLANVARDSESARLEARFTHRTTWTRTRLTAVCAKGLPASLLFVEPDVALHIERIMRLTNFATRFTNIGEISGADGYPFTVDAPLLVTLRLPPAIVHAAKTSCAQTTARFAGAWDFERQFRLRSRRASHPDWSASMFAEIARGQVLVGMTRDMIAEMSGYPSQPGTIEELNRLPQWRYVDFPPFSRTVYFRHDRVWAYDPPGRLP